MGLLVWIVGVLGVFLFWMVSVYNRLIALIEAIRNNFKQIDIQLDRRFKVFESLIEVLKQYMDYEKSTLKEVVALRQSAQQAAHSGDVATQIQAENQISRILGGLNVVVEAYPNLKADKNAQHFQEEIVHTENLLTAAKQAYNDSVERYNAKKGAFFEAMVVALYAAKLDRSFDYWGLSEAEVSQKENHRVQFKKPQDPGHA